MDSKFSMRCRAVSHQTSDTETKINEKPSSASKRVILKKTQKGTRTLAKNKTRSKQTVSTVSGDLQNSQSTNQRKITKNDTYTKADESEAKEAIVESDIALHVSSDVAQPASGSQAGLALELKSQTSPEAEGVGAALVLDSSREAESDATTDVWKLKPSSASGTEGKESDVISVISIPDGKLKVGHPSSAKSNDRLPYGEKMEKGKKSKMTEKQINQEDSTERKGLKQKRNLNDKRKSKDKLLKDGRFEGKQKEEADTKKSKDTGSMSFLKAASRLSITEKYSLHKASRKSISKEESRPSSASVTTSTEYHTSSAISSRATPAGYKPSCIDTDDPNLDEEEYLIEESRDEKKNTSRRLKESKGLKSLIRLQQQSTDEQSYFEEESGVRGRSKESLIHPLFSDMNMCLKSTVDDGTIARPNTAEYGNRRRYSLERPHTVATGDLYALQDDMSFDSHYLQRNISLPG
ncbi:uncharacterized protein [Antedon mediterranea]|uniref:uncharacterized protein n=1 Tax=Antedon mediterranea TaxID=105859 RepID=UPI003AF410D9